jgi:uncharacterized repeat protein (TIGR03803 family)
MDRDRRMLTWSLTKPEMSTAQRALEDFTDTATVYELMPSNGSWTESVLYSFSGGSDGGLLAGGVVPDSAGNLCGTTFQGGAPGCQLGKGCGTVFELTPSNGGWIETVLYTFQGENDGGNPGGGLIFDQFGSLYGTTGYSNGGNLGTVFKLAPSNNGWAFTLIYKFQRGYPGSGSLIMDASGNLYGTTQTDGAYGQGSVYELTPFGNGRTYTSLHDRTGGSDGVGPMGSVTIDTSGNLYGTAYAGGFNFGVVWEITP